MSPEVPVDSLALYQNYNVSAECSKMDKSF
jgi:hypothetical protein